MPTITEIFQALPVIASLILIEGLLSVDNALAIAAMASHLPGRQKHMALRWGIIGAYAFRGLALAFAAFIIENPWLKIVGAAYLVHLMASFFADKAKADNIDDQGSEPTIAGKLAAKSFWATVVSIELMDLSLSVDNVVAAVALSPKLWVVCVGVFIGILVLRYVAGACIRLIERFPILESTAFLLIGYVGCILIIELTTQIHVTAFQKFTGICIILGLSILYSESKALKSPLKPIFKMLRMPLIAYAAFSNFIIDLALFPFILIRTLFKKKDSAARI